MTSTEIRDRFLTFYKKHHHAVIESASLVPQNDPTVLFTTAGMQQFKAYYTGEQNAEKDFGERNVVTIQKCVRTGDIEEVGDNTHLTFFEMLGNFSFGGYWKKEAITFAYEFITKELGLIIDYVSVFEGDTETPADEESRTIWNDIDSSLEVRNHNRADNFWGPTGSEGPCGPTTEIYIKNVEVWNIVFNEFYKTKEGVYQPLQTKGIDTGMGLERLLVMAQQKTNVYETDVFTDIINRTQAISKNSNITSIRIISDHIRTAVLMLSDGVIPSNTDRGYILRRLLRRAVRHADIVGIEPGNLNEIAGVVIAQYGKIYPMVQEKNTDIMNAIKTEEEKFRETLTKGLKEFEKGTDPFILFSSYGFPIELTEELAKEKGITIDRAQFDAYFKEHQEKSRSAGAGMFKGGLANAQEATIKLHTAHHLLLAALQEMFGKEVKQRGSNITEERLRIDFSFDRKLTDEEKQLLEAKVNEKIKENLKVTKKEMPKEEAEKIGAEMEFGAKYGDTVCVYFIENEAGEVFSKEFCGGPHVESTSALGTFKILKEEASAQGVRRIKAVLQ